MYDKYNGDIQATIAFSLAKWYFRGLIHQDDYKKLIHIYLIKGQEIYLGNIDDYELSSNQIIL